MFKQTTLLKFSDSLPELNCKSMTRFIEQSERIYSKMDYEYELFPDNTIEITQTHCLRCHSRLYRNGYNFRHLRMDYGLGIMRFKLHRKRCPKYGEIEISINKLGNKYAHIDKNFKRRARRLYSIGLRLRQIVNVFKICFNIKISKTQIYNWINEVKEELRDLLNTTKVPSSGYIGYDEIFCKIMGQKVYLLATIDVNTKFIPSALVYDNKNSKNAKLFLKQVKKNMDEKLKGIVKDCSTVFGKLFHSRGWNNIELQDCHTHVKWICSKHVKAFAGLSEQSIKPVPDEWLGLLGKFYRIINSRNESSAYCNIETLRYKIEGFKGKKSKHLRIAFDFLESHIDEIIQWRSNPFLPKTNNLTEGFHKKYEYYPEFKKGMKTKSGLQFIADLVVFNHNFGKFSGYIEELEDKIYNIKFLLDDPSEFRLRQGQSLSLSSELKRTKATYQKYLKIWNKYFKILPKNRKK